MSQRAKSSGTPGLLVPLNWEKAQSNSKELNSNNEFNESLLAVHGHNHAITLLPLWQGLLPPPPPPSPSPLDGTPLCCLRRKTDVLTFTQLPRNTFSANPWWGRERWIARPRPPTCTVQHVEATRYFRHYPRNFCPVARYFW